MKTNDELKSIAGNIFLQVKAFVKSHGMLKYLTDMKPIEKEAKEMYARLRGEYQLSDEENHKVDHYFFRASILGSRKQWKERKKEGDKDG